MFKYRGLLATAAAAVALSAGAFAMAQTEDEELSAAPWRTVVLAQLRAANLSLERIVTNTEQDAIKAPLVVDFRVGTETAGIEPVICWTTNRTDPNDMCANRPDEFCTKLGYRSAKFVSLVPTPSNPRNNYLASLVCTDLAPSQTPG